MKKLSFIKRSNGSHWVGDGFPVRNIFSYDDLAKELSPFLLLDYAGPFHFPPTQNKLGVGEHPHRGFETVTIVYQGEVEHRDSAGGGGKIGPGEVQWMTAASGLVHEEFHGTEFAKSGGIFEIIQLWVNLPAEFKKSAPRYQGITKEQIPEVALPEEAGTLRVIAGQYDTRVGPAQTFSPMNIWDIRIQAGKRATFQVTPGFTTSIFLLNGSIRFPGKTTEETIVKVAELAVLEREGDQFTIDAVDQSTLLILNGKPLNEPIIGRGPFVMNTHAEIEQAMRDYQSGKMGRLN